MNYIAATQYLGWYLAGIILVIGLSVGFADLLRFSGKRIWAISGVCFDESIRRRILWITPLAILGIVVVSQLQRPMDEQDAIRQTIKICLFTTGIVVVISTIILACTNLPREIENRVIYTVVTKPTTRLEIIVGKVLGFARVSAAILIIMGVFSYGYLLVRSWSMQRYITDRMESPELPASERQTLEHYKQTGLLHARTLEQPDDLQVFASAPEPGATMWSMAGGGEGSFILPFNLSKQDLTPDDQPDATPGADGAQVLIQIGYRRKEQAEKKSPSQVPATSPAEAPYYGPYVMSPEERQAIMAKVKPQSNPQISIEILDRFMNGLGNATSPLTNKPLELLNKNGPSHVLGYIPPNVAASMAGQPTFIRVTGLEKDVEYYVGKDPLALLVPIGNGQGRRLNPTTDTPKFIGRSGTFGQQLRGSAGGKGAVGVYAYRNARFNGIGPATFEGKFGIERSGNDMDSTAFDQDEPTEITVRVRNLKTGNVSDPVVIRPESNRTTFFNVSADAVAGGDFDVLMQCQTPGHFVGLQSGSLSMITSRQSFMLNLAQSLSILWLMSILVTTVAIFTSTFLSWPIAVVLTLLILLGHWGVEQLGDATAPGIGNQIVNDLGLTKSAPAKAVSATVERLSGLLNFMSTILPDIGQFAAMEDIERGVTISSQRLASAAAVALGFGLPLTILAYVVLKNKEVAP
jgi:ABC-type transport system involved in multi-copper enzyme maturation permease subunit